ncbi:MAG: DUF3089 domain-containing protein, partial [Myxococcota bacterium]
AWTAHPSVEDAADAVPKGLRAIDQSRAPADVFYVHPTSYLGPNWNGPVDDPVLNAQTDELATLIQASAFNGCCAVYGPRYRQAHGHAFVFQGPDSEAAIDLAYQDVRVAFHAFLATWNRGRPFILAGHSQGSVLAARLLQEEISGRALQDRLVAAYLIGGPILAADFPDLPTCGAPEQTGCVIGWNARGPRFVGNVFDFPRRGRRLCVNPLSWRDDEQPVPAEENRGAVFLHAGAGTPLPGFADAACREGLLMVSEIGEAPRDTMSRILDFVIGPQNYHPFEVQLYYMDLRENAEERVASFLRRGLRTPQEAG